SAQAAGAGWIRLSLGWRLINPSQGTFTYTAVDKLVSGAHSRGMKVLGMLADTPNWASSDPSCATTCSADASLYPPADYTNWTAFVSNLATHYAQACHTDPSLCVEAYEVWNEPGTGVGHWKGTPAQYAQLLSTAYDAIHAADSQATVLNGGLTSVGPNPSDWLAQVMTDSRFPC